MPAGVTFWKKKTFFSKLLEGCISKNIWSWELIFGGESALILKSPKMDSICENPKFGQVVSRSPPPQQISNLKSIENTMKIQQKSVWNVVFSPPFSTVWRVYRF